MEHGFCLHSGNVYGVPPCSSFETRAPVHGRFPPVGGSYFVGFGPLLLHFIRKPNLYLGRGASLLIWSPHIPISFADFHRAWKTIWPVLSENLLGISTHTSQDIIFYGPLLFTLPKARSWSWALRCFCGTGVIRPRFSYSPRARCLARGRNARGVSEQRATPDQSLDSLPFPGLLYCAAVPVGAWINGGTIGVVNPGSAGSCGNGRDCAYSCLGLCNLHFISSLLRRP